MSLEWTGISDELFHKLTEAGSTYYRKHSTLFLVNNLTDTRMELMGSHRYIFQAAQPMNKGKLVGPLIKKENILISETILPTPEATT